MLFVWARDVDNVEAPYRASELALLNIWNLLRPYIGKSSRGAGKAILTVLHEAIRLHLMIASELLERKILPHVGLRDAISMAVRTRSAVDVNLKLFDVLGRIGLTGVWVHWLIEHDPDVKRREAAQGQAARFATMGYQLIDNNRALFLPLQDQHAIDIALFLVLVGVLNGSKDDTRAWLHEMVGRLALTLGTHGRYPCVFTEYRDLIAHPRESTDEYRKEATPGSILIPVLSAFLSALNDHDALDRLVDLKAKELRHCTLQMWMPDQLSEDGIYIGAHNHGLALCDLPLSATGDELLKIVRDACEQSKDFDQMSAIATGYWPMILTACRHYRLPVPPQFWIKMVEPLSES